MLAFFSIIGLQIIFAVYVSLQGRTVFKAFQSLKNEFYWDEVLDDLKLSQELTIKQMEKDSLIQYPIFMIELFPFIGLIISIVYCYFLRNYRQTINACYVELEKYKTKKEDERLLSMLPSHIQKLIRTSRILMIQLKERKYHVVIADESFQTLKSLIRNSFIERIITDESLKKIEDSCLELIAFLSKLIAKHQEEIDNFISSQQSSINESFDKYQSVLKNMTKDLESKKGVF